MQIGKIIRNTFVGLSALGATACVKAPLHEVRPSEEVSQMIEILNYDTKSLWGDSTYKCFAKDTVRLDTNDLSKTKMNIKASEIFETPEKTVGYKQTAVPLVFGNAVRIVPNNIPIKKAEFVNTKAVIGDKGFSDFSG